MEELEITDIFWDALEFAEDPTVGKLSEGVLQLLYDHGFADEKNVPRKRWQETLRKFPQEEKGIYLIKESDLPKIARILHSGPIKRPFDPFRLKDGLRAPEWLTEMYQKVLCFETTLKIVEWNNLVDNKLKKHHFREGKFVFNQASKEVIQGVLDHKASPLRKLELWVHVGRPGDKETKKKAGTPAPPIANAPEQIKDRFDTSPQGSQKMRAIEKLYYQGEGQKKRDVDDKEALKFLDELEDMGDDEDSELP